MKRSNTSSFKDRADLPIGLPAESLQTRAANLNGALSEVNNQLETLRYRLFGDDLARPSGENGAMPSMRESIEEAQKGALEAQSQIGSILDRL